MSQGQRKKTEDWDPGARVQRAILVPGASWRGTLPKSTPRTPWRGVQPLSTPWRGVQLPRTPWRGVQQQRAPTKGVQHRAPSKGVQPGMLMKGVQMETPTKGVQPEPATPQRYYPVWFRAVPSKLQDSVVGSKRKG